jgi:hypothetical protein
VERGEDGPEGGPRTALASLQARCVDPDPAPARCLRSSNRPLAGLGRVREGSRPAVDPSALPGSQGAYGDRARPHAHRRHRPGRHSTQPRPVNAIARDLGLEVSRKAPVEETVERIRGCLLRHGSGSSEAQTCECSSLVRPRMASLNVLKCGFVRQSGADGGLEFFTADSMSFGCQSTVR